MVLMAFDRSLVSPWSEHPQGRTGLRLCSWSWQDTDTEPGPFQPLLTRHPKAGLQER